MVNERAVAADDAFFATAGPQGIYHYYRAHNAHFLIWAAMFQGNKKKAMEAAYAMVSKLPKEGMSKLPRSVESYLFVPMHVMMRFGLWEEILQYEKPEEQYSIAVALYHHARAVAYANSERLDEAMAEAKLFEEIAATIPEEKQVRRAPVKTILNIARFMMRGEILFKQGERDEAFVALRKAVEYEDTIPYSEPPGWMQPMRHALGALLLEDGRPSEAEAVYLADLAQHAENGWSLLGLADSLRMQGRTAEAEAVDARFRLAWADADTEITASCFCRTQD
ncbi:MAG: tetratricopeptide repeat protein [Planctomycetota bacterium]|jgi:tetratricopeptide (TPR) repeat protein